MKGSPVRVRVSALPSTPLCSVDLTPYWGRFVKGSPPILGAFWGHSSVPPRCFSAAWYVAETPHSGAYWGRVRAHRNAVHGAPPRCRGPPANGLRTTKTG